jgi:transposase
MSIVEATEVLPYLSGLRLDDVISGAQHLVVRAAVDTAQVCCPTCSTPTRRVHSTYERRLLDPAIAGRQATIELRVRRFFCDNDACGRKTFVEQVSGLTTRFGRRTLTARHVVTAVAFALGGRVRATRRRAGRTG